MSNTQSFLKLCFSLFQLISELVLRSVAAGDDGTYYCSAQNPAGVATANLTLKVKVTTRTDKAGLKESSSGALEENSANGAVINKDDEDDDMIKVRVACLKISKHYFVFRNLEDFALLG